MANDFADSKVIFTLPWNSEAPTAVAFLANDKLAVGNRQGDILVWNLTAPEGKTPDPVRRLVGHVNEINRLLVTPDGRVLISASSDHTIKYWDAQSEQGEPGSVVLNDGIVRAGVVERLPKFADPPPPVEVKVVVQKPIRDLTAHKEWVHGLAQTPDGRTLVSGDDKGVVIVWNLPEGKELSRWNTKYWAYSLGVSPDGKTVAISEFLSFRHPEPQAMCRGFQLWDTATGLPKADLSAEIKGCMSDVRFSPDGKWLALCAGGSGEEKPEGRVVLLDPASGKKLRELAPHFSASATCLAFHPNGAHLFACGREALVRIWQLEDGKHVRDLGKARERGDWFSSIAISPDGRLLAAADMAGQVLVYSLTT